MTFEAMLGKHRLQLLQKIISSLGRKAKQGKEQKAPRADFHRRMDYVHNSEITPWLSA